MAPINGRPFLEYQLDYWIGQGINHFILSVGYRHELIMAHFGAQYREGRIEYAIEETPVGTGGGLLLSIEKLTDHCPFLLLNGDTFFEVILAELFDFHVKRQSDWTFSLFKANEADRYMGMEMDNEGRILALNSGAGKPGRLANGGVYLVNPEILYEINRQYVRKRSLEDDVLPTLMAGGARFYGRECDGRFIDIGAPEDYLRSAEIISAGR